MRVLGFAAVVLASRAAAAAPLAQLDHDLDGDGAIDHVMVTPEGVLELHLKSRGQSLALGMRPTHASLAAAQLRGAPAVVVHLSSGHGDEVMVVEYRGTWTQVLRERIGGVGLDRDYATDIGVAANGIYRYQVRPGIRRCDGKPAYLFAEGWDKGRFKRLSKLPVDVADSAPVLAAHLDPATPPQPLLYQARAASHEPGATDAGALAIPTELDDGKPATFWHEELVTSDGEGQFFTFEPRSTGARAAQLRIVPGNPASAKTARSYNRPKRIAIVGASGAWHVDLPDAANDAVGAAYVVDLPTPIEGCATVVLESTYGASDGTTAIAELELFAEGERSAGGGEAALAHVVAEGTNDVQAAMQALARRGAAGAGAVDAELAKTKDAEARTRLFRALIEIKDPAVGPPIARAIADGSVRDEELDTAVAALAALGMSQELHDLAASRTLPVEARVAAARSLAGTDKVIDLAGDGSRELRRAVIDAMATLAVATLVPAAQADSSAKGAGDIWRAITKRARQTTAERDAAVAAMIAALPGSTDYERRYRLVDGLVALGDTAALHQIEELLRALPQGGERAAYEQIAARAIATSPRPEALDLLVWLLKEPDPGVRYAALSALATPEGDLGGASGPWHAAVGADGIDRVIQTALASDTWPEVRARAAQMLGGRCMRPGPARSLADAIARDPELAVRGDSLAALVECKAAGVADLLAKTWDNAKQPIELRQRAVDLGVVLGDRALAQKLVAKLAQWRGAALESQEALALAQNAAYAVGRLAPPGAADALEDALQDAAFPEIIAAAATGLGLMGPACPASARTKLRTLAHSEEQQVQVAAAHAAALCGK